MDRTTAGDGGAGWNERTVGAGADPPRALLLWQDGTPGAPGAPSYTIAVSKEPAIARDDRNIPIFSLTLLLSRRPALQETTVFELIQQGFLSLDLTFALPSALRAAVAQETGSECRPLFARSARLWLAQDGGEIAETVRETSGTEPRAGFSLTLDREQTLAVLDALDGLDGAATGLTAHARITYAAPGGGQSLVLSGQWARVYDYLVTLQETPGNLVVLDRATLQRALSGMAARGSIKVTRVPAAPAGQPEGLLTEQEAALLLPDFLIQAGLILERMTPQYPLNDPANQYTLRGYPPEGFQFRIQRTPSPTLANQTLELSAPLEKLLPRLLDGQERDAFLRLIAPEGMTGLGPVPRRVPSQPRRHDRNPEAAPIALAARNGELRALSAVMRPNAAARPSTSALIHSDTIQPVPIDDGRIRHWIIPDLVIVPDDTPLESLPVVGNQAAALWQDRKDDSRYWFPPSYTLVPPPPNADPATAPFLFSYRPLGATSAGKPAIEATVRFTLQGGMSEATRAALQAKGNPPAQAVPPLGLAVALELPFLDQSNTLRTQRFDGSVTSSGSRVTVTVRLLNDWARLGYGALAVAGFQLQRARLVIAYSYRAYVPVPRDRLKIAFGGRTAVTPVFVAGEDAPAQPRRAVLNAAALEVQMPAATLRFEPESPAAGADARAAITDRHAWAQPVIETRGTVARAAGPVVAAHPIAASISPARRPILDELPEGAVRRAPRPAVILPRPDLAESIVLHEILNTTDYVVQTLATQQFQDTLLPCNTLGAFYRREENGASIAVGCQDALQLGKTTYRQFEAVPELRHPLYEVYRSLQQPGRFLIVPTTYRITRYASSDSQRAYRPVIVLHASLDANHPENNQYVYEATLQADLPPYARRLLRDRLHSYAQNPTLLYPTEIECEAAYAWLLAIPNVAHAEVKIPEGFWISFATRLDSAPLLHSMLQSNVTGTVTFTLPDRTTFSSRLELDLRNVTGPWEDGPIAVTPEEGVVILANRIEQTVAVSDLNVYDRSGALQTVAVNTSLTSGAVAGSATTVALPSGPAPREPMPVYTVIPGRPVQPQEIDTFAEAISTNVIFINLLSYAKHNLKQLEILARLKGVDHNYPVATDEAQRVGQLMLTLPLTTYQQNQTAQFQVTKRFNDGQTETTPWLEQDLSQSHIISIVWELIQ